MREMIKNTLILMVITLVAGLLLGVVYENTKDVIATQEIEAKKAAYKDVFNEASDFNAMDDFMNVDIRNSLNQNGFEYENIDEINAAVDANGSLIGYVFTITTKEGYGGDITFTLGINKNGTVNGISILSISETAGLGMEADKVLKPQFANKKADSFVYTKTGASAENEIDAISGATITTNAITNGVNTGLYYFEKYLGGADNE